MLRASAVVMVSAALLGLGAALGGCLVFSEVYSCEEPALNRVDSQGAADPCGFRNRCPGECVPVATLGFTQHALLWIGSASEAPPPCPATAPTPDPVPRFADLVALNECGTCACAPPTGSCELPTSIYARASLCQVPGGWVTPFDAPTGWDGTCTAVNAIPPGTLCGGKPCVQSLVVAPLKAVDKGCVPVASPPPAKLASIYWKTQALACVGNLDDDSCGDPKLTCVPNAEPPPPEFKQCVFKEGDAACPPAYPEKHVFYEKYDDKRACSDCQCESAEGSVCTAAIKAYTTTADCTGPKLELLVSSVGSVCADIQLPGAALSSKTVSDLTYHPGSCKPSGGEPIGSVEMVKPSTFCCLGKN